MKNKYASEQSPQGQNILMGNHLYNEGGDNTQTQGIPLRESYKYFTEIGNGRYKMKMHSTGALAFTLVLSGIMAAIGITIIILYITALNKVSAENSNLATAGLIGIGFAGFCLLIAALPFFLRRKTIFDTASRMIVVGRKAYPFDTFVKFEVSNLYCLIKIFSILWIKIRVHEGSKPKSLRIKILGPLTRTKTTEKYFKEISSVMGLL